jgi:hypothetical protein
MNIALLVTRAGQLKLMLVLDSFHQSQVLKNQVVSAPARAKKQHAGFLCGRLER